VSTGSIVVARIGVTVAVALVQMVIFVGLAIAAFGLQLTGSWWMAVPILFCGTLAFMAIGLLAGRGRLRLRLDGHSITTFGHIGF